MNKNMKVNISDGQEFFAHETSIQFSPTQVILDFKSVTPRIDPRSQDGPVYSIRHNVVLMEPHHTVQFIDLLQKIVSRYEKQFGKITVPKSVLKAQKLRASKKNQKKPITPKIEAPHYLG